MSFKETTQKAFQKALRNMNPLIDFMDKREQEIADQWTDYIIEAHQAEIAAILEGLKAKATNWGNGKDLIDPEDIDEAIRKARGQDK